MSKEIIKVVVIEDDRLIRESFVDFINENDMLKCTGSYESCEQAIKNLHVDNPRIVLMDITLPGISGIEGIKRIKKINPNIETVVVTVHEDDQIVFDALCAGASGYLTKNISSRRLIESIIETYNGGAPMSTNIARLVVKSFHKSISSPLSPRETEVLQFLAKGKSYSMIADELFIDKETVRTHIKNIYIKLEVHSKAKAIEKAEKNKLI
jgi:DNA-binding NarL/FixJ family response regulator